MIRKARHGKEQAELLKFVFRSAGDRAFQEIMIAKQSLVGKRVLLIAPRTFGYEREITRSLEALGAAVHYYDDRPFDDNLRKVVLRLFPALLQSNVAAYFRDIVATTSSISFDVVFCIKMECFPRAILEELKQQQPNAEFVFYTWDSFENNPNAVAVLDVFERKYSFDKQNAKSLGIQHRPLFYLSEYSELRNRESTYDATFIGSVHYRRYRFVKRLLAKYADSVDFFVYLFVPSKWLFYARKVLLFPWYGGSHISEFRFAPLKKEQILDILAESRCVVDYSHHRQDGLTMRVIEAVGARKKIITTNQSITEYEFYHPSNVLVVDEDDPQVPSEFLEQPYVEISDQVYQRYSIGGWLEEILFSPHSDSRQ